MKLAIVICGQIGSGKSTLVDHVASEIDAKVVSFGDFVRHVARQQNRLERRRELQDIGETMIRSKGHRGFLQSTLAHFDIDDCDSVVFDGVRHIEIFQTIRDLAETSKSFYLEVDSEERRRRRETGSAGPLTLGAFTQIEEHPVESETTRLHQFCDFIVDANRDLESVRESIMNEISVELPTC